MEDLTRDIHKSLETVKLEGEWMMVGHFDNQENRLPQKYIEVA